ncbi:MAG: hypothetical protein ACWGSD_08345 [Thermodesulfobacteriota bacterium]
MLVIILLICVANLVFAYEASNQNEYLANFIRQLTVETAKLKTVLVEVSQIAETREKVMLSFMDLLERSLSKVTATSQAADALSGAQEPARMTVRGWIAAGDAEMLSRGRGQGVVFDPMSDPPDRLPTEKGPPILATLSFGTDAIPAAQETGDASGPEGGDGSLYARTSSTENLPPECGTRISLRLGPQTHMLNLIK